MVSSKPHVTSTTDASGNPIMTTVWDTVTVFDTVTVTMNGPGPTASPASPTPPTTNGSLPDVAGWKFAGCYKDDGSRVLQGEHLPKLGPMTNQKCVTHCQSQGFSVSGTEYGSQCFCGNSIQGPEKLDESSCDMACDGDSTDTCGGSWALSVYSKDGSARKRHAHNHALRHSYRP